MTLAKAYGRRVNAGNQKHLDRAFGGSQGDKQAFLFRHSTDNVRTSLEDFLGTLNTALWTAGATGTGTAFAASGAAGGTAQGATGTTTQAGISIKGPLGFSGAMNPGIEVRFKISAITAFCMELGFLDAITTATGAAFSSIDTPALNTGVGDIAVVGLRTSDTANKLNLCTAGSGGGSQVPTALTLGTLLPTAATYMKVRIQLINESGSNTTSIVVTVDDKPTQQFTQATAAGQLVAATVLRPWIYFGDTAAGSTRTVDIDYIDLWADRV